jgi:predicted nucleic acid-binding protein
MAIAQARHWILASDHPRIRNFARAKKIRLTGTLGILVKAFKTNILSLSEVISIHTHLVNQGYRSPYRQPDDFLSFLRANIRD